MIFRARGPDQPGAFWSRTSSVPVLVASRNVRAICVLVFDLESEVERLHAKGSWRPGTRNAKKLVKESDFRTVLVVLKSGTDAP